MASLKKFNGTTWDNAKVRKLGTSTDTLTTLPAVVYADGNNATVGLKGNMSQTGTPTPDNPIIPQECGDRTENLFDGSLFNGVYRDANFNIVTDSSNVYKCCKIYFDSGTYTMSFTKAVSIVRLLINGTYAENVETNVMTYTFTIINSGYFGITFRDSTSSSTVWVNSPIMLNLGSTALPYEPYGYKLTISSASTTTPVYLGEVESTRRIKKYVITGNETIRHYDYDYQRFLLTIPTIPSMGTRLTPIICTHYIGIYDGRPIAQVPMYAVYTGSDTDNSVLIKTDQTTDRSTFIAWLQEQYANGTPVTLWYAVSTPETAVVNEPIRKIGDYADTVSGITIPTITGKDTFDVETTLKPSEVELTYTGWHDASVQDS